VAEPLTIIFAGTPDFAACHLAALLIADHYHIAGVYTQPDRPAGRGQKPQFSPVKQLALQHSLKVFQPVDLKSPQQQQQLATLQPDLMIVVAYGLLLPKPVLAIPRLGCINVHASLLPRWRGAAPIQRALLAGDQITGVSIMQMNAGLDTGPVFQQQSCTIQPKDTGGSLHDRLARLGAETLLNTLPKIATAGLLSQPQTDSQVSYAHKLSKQEARIDWTQSAEHIARQVRAYNPWPIAYSQLAHSRLRIWQADALTSETSQPPGTIVQANKEAICIATGSGVLAINQLQLAGGKVMTAEAMLNARRDQFQAGQQLA
jgi:methionyl-tRNA formyltransferase